MKRQTLFVGGRLKNLTGGEMIGSCEYHKGFNGGQEQGCIRPDPPPAYFLCAGRAGGSADLFLDPQSFRERCGIDFTDCHGAALFLFRHV